MYGKQWALLHMFFYFGTIHFLAQGSKILNVDILTKFRVEVCLGK